MTRTAMPLFCLFLLGATGCAPGEHDDTSRLLARFELDAREVFTSGPDGSMERLADHPDLEVGERIVFAPETCSLEGQAQRLAGPDARDCGVVGLDEAPEPAEWCAAEAFAFGEAFTITYVIQGYEQRLEEMISGNAQGDVFFTVVDTTPCGSDACPPSYRSSLCVGPSVTESGTIGCDRYRPLIQVICD